MTIQASTLLSTPAGAQWRQIGVRQHHGINLPLFSLRTRQSCGIGEFTDLYPLLDWCKELGLDIIQLLPLNDGGLETSPYCSLSAFALNPMHLGLAHLPYLEKVPEVNTRLHALQQLSQTQRVDYPRVHDEREAFLRLYYQYAGPVVTNTYDFHQFNFQHLWLDTYALFKTIKVEQQWQSWEAWPDALRHLTAQHYQNLLHKYKEEVTYHRFIQYLCFQQLTQVKKRAQDKGIFIKGDIPILINRDSADVWRHCKLFALDYAAGAPPDLYSEEGQLWGFPLYNWEEMEKHHYNWWKERLTVASAIYHIYRLDHIVGFFRIWGVPLGKSAKNGSFIPADPTTWVPQGEKILRMMLAHCPLLPIGEDLGVIPPEVRTCMRHLGICGTKVMRWERLWNTEDQPFIPPQDYPVESMTTVSTHDSETLQLWWKNNPQEAEAYARFKDWPYEPLLSIEQHREILRDSHHTASLFHINLLQEYLALVPGMTWPDPEDERINIPGLISPKNWSYRFKPYVEELIASASLRQEFQHILK